VDKYLLAQVACLRGGEMLRAQPPQLDAAGRLLERIERRVALLDAVLDEDEEDSGEGSVRRIAGQTRREDTNIP
jgi:hypothetical protein